MKLLIAIVIIAVISIIGSRISFFNRRLPLGLRNILLTGTEYVFLGAFLGHLGVGLLDEHTLYLLKPFLLFGLCWVGFLFGLQFEVRQLKKLPAYYFSITAVQSLVCFVVVAVPTYFLFDYFGGFTSSINIMLSVLLGGMASSTAQSALAIVSRNYKVKNKQLMELMRYVAGVDGVFALLFFALALGVIPWGQITRLSPLLSIQWTVILIMVGFIPALVLMMLNRDRFSQQEFTVFVIGANMFCAGLAQVTGHSPLLAGFICGLLTANYCRNRIRALSLVIHAEKTIYIALLILLGASWKFVSLGSLIIAIIYILLKILGKYIGGYFAVSVFKPYYYVPKTYGLAMVSEGGLSVAIIINFKLLYPYAADGLVAVILFAIIISELITPRLIQNQFSKDGYQLINKEAS